MTGRWASTRLAVLGAAASLILLGAACSSHSAASKDHVRGKAGTIRPTRPGAGPSQGIPATYEQACAQESDCAGRPIGPVPAVLMRPLHFPVLGPGQRCPATHGDRVDSPDFVGIALGNGPVRVRIDNVGDLRDGVADLGGTTVPGWFALKTHWISVPAYQGPFLVRAERLDRPGPVSLGATPPQGAPLVVPPGPTLNGGPGWREVPYFTWMKAPGCYAWQIDGMKFSEIVVVRGVPPPKSLG